MPVDLTDASTGQVRIAEALAEALNVELVALHVIEPVRNPLADKLDLTRIQSERRSRAVDAVMKLIAAVPPQLHTEALVVEGDPAEQIAAAAKDRAAGLIVIGLHGSPAGGPGMGSVTYRVVCLSPVLLLAVPPAPVGTSPPAPSMWTLASTMRRD